MERDVSPTTGLPWWLTRSGHPDVGYLVETVHDAAEQALDEYDEKRRESKKPKHGEHRYAVPQALGDEEIEGGLARERLLNYAAQQAQGLGEDSDAELVDLGVDVRARGGEYDATQYG